MSCGIFVQFFKCKILMSGKFVSFIASYTLCIAVEAEGVPSDVLVITVASWILYVANERKINSPFGNFLTKIIIFCFKQIVDRKNCVYYTARKCFASARTSAASAAASAPQTVLALAK
jgi:hypothetical protein